MQTKSTNQKTVLLADDDETIREVITGILVSKKTMDPPLIVDAAADGEETLKKIRESKTPYDLLILDMRMPKMNGDEVLMKCWEIKASIHMPKQILIITGFLDTLSKETAFQERLWVMGKPFQSAKFMSLVTRLVSDDPGVNPNPLMPI